MRRLAYVKLIHKSNVFFNVKQPAEDNIHIANALDKMHRGELYIYQNNIFLFDGLRWYRADINDIREIHSSAANKQILIQFWNYDLLLFSNDYSHLLALRDFIFLSNRKPPMLGNLLLPDSGGIGGFK